MKEKLLDICDNILSAILKLTGIVFVAYITMIGVGLWTHLHRYAVDALK